MMRNFFDNRRGVFFSTDALLALLIIFFVLLVVFPDREHVRVTSEAPQDILDSLSVLQVGEVNDSYVALLIAQGVISELNQSLLQQIGEFAVTNVSVARQLASSVLSGLNLTGNVGVWYGSVLVYSNNASALEGADDVDTARLILSGIREGESITGFSARAFLSSNLISDYFYFGGYVGDGNLSFIVPYSGVISSAELELAVNSAFELFVNNISQGSFAPSPSEFSPVSYTLNVSDFFSGNNSVSLRGNTLHVAGGFLRVSYRPNVSFSSMERYRFPGIDGLINLYDGFHVPGDLHGMEIQLHMNSSITPVFLNIGNVTVFNGTTNDEEVISISNATLSSLLDYSALSQESVPLRLGLENVSYLGIEQDIDVFSVTDLSGSMSDCAIFSDPLTCRYQCWPVGGSKSCVVADPSECTGNVCGGSCWFVSLDHALDCESESIDLAKQANDLFIDSILNSSELNQVGLIGYKSSVSSGDVHILSNDSASLKGEVSSWVAGGGTCICCGINRAVSDLLNQSDPEKFQSIVVMSDGQANVECSEQGTGDPSQDAIAAACSAFANESITVHAIGFGDSVDEATLQQIADCGNGDYYYSAIDELVSIYEQVAQNIISEYVEQSLGLTGDLSTRLYEDSFISFDYSAPQEQTGLVISLEQRFDDASSGTFSVPADSSVLEARVTSYSGPRWTDSVLVDGVYVYNLSSYGDDYITLGDPYIVTIPPSLLGQGVHQVNLSTGVNPSNSSIGSDSNMIIYSLLKNASSFSPILSSADGCVWEIEFEDDTIVSTSIPGSYVGIEACLYNSSFSSGVIVDENDAYQVAVQDLLQQMDVDSDGKVDFLFTQEDLSVSVDEVTGIPFTWSSEVQARRWF